MIKTRGPHWLVGPEDNAHETLSSRLVFFAEDPQVVDAIVVGMIGGREVNNPHIQADCTRALAATYNKGLHQEKIKSLFRKMILEGDELAFDHREFLAPIVASDPVLAVKIADPISRFYASVEPKQRRFSAFASSGVFMARLSPSDRLLPDMVSVSMLQQQVGDIKASYLIAFIEKNMNGFYYRGHKMWEYDDGTLFFDTFGHEPRTLVNGANICAMVRSADERKRHAIVALVEQEGAAQLFERLFPIDPNI